MDFENDLKAAEDGDYYAMVRVSQCYQLGADVEQDREKAIYWLKKCADVERKKGLGMFQGTVSLPTAMRLHNLGVEY